MGPDGDLHLRAIYPYSQAEVTELSAQPSVQDGMYWPQGSGRLGTTKILILILLSAEDVKDKNWHVETSSVLAAWNDV